MRPRIIVGNWKMHKTAKEAVQFVDALAPQISGISVQVLLAVSFTSISSVAGRGIGIGAQNMHEELEGPFTGEVSVSMLQEAGAEFVLLGHSERRHLFSETDEQVHKKLKRALESGLRPILCIGESLEEREANKTEEVLGRQIESAFQGLDVKGLKPVIIAYEPVWAIGTGKTATPEVAQEAHAFCRHFIAAKWGLPLADQLPLLYGGSVTPATAPALMKEPDIDGALVGGAALKLESFLQIIHSGVRINS